MTGTGATTGGGEPGRASDRPWSLRVLSEAEFLASEAEYADLLARSDADPLFMGWEWLSRWWALHKEPYGLSLQVHVAEDAEGRWLGAAPVTRRRVTHRRLLRGTRLEILGGLWREDDSVLTEYQTLPVVRGRRGEVVPALVASVLDTPGWADLCLKFCPEQSATWTAFLGAARERGWYARSHDRLYAHRLDLAAGFEAFLASLSQRSRLRIYNARRRLAKVGQVRFVVAGEEDLERAFAALDELHESRWGKPALHGLRGELYRDLARLQLAQAKLALSFLLLDGKPVAAALNFREDGCEYGIQSGFRDDVEKRVSPGYLHIGYMIERACRDGLRHFDFLAGEGKESNYKRHFKAEESPIGSIQIVRSRLLTLVYGAYDRIRGHQGDDRQDASTGEPPA